ncbi:hypothetical protein SFR_6978 (plasmid) [Streptomyces sp. FR-008]|nr:hypothetical protein SFR_6978 [Streptomyces sp. FR-008]
MRGRHGVEADEDGAAQSTPAGAWPTAHQRRDS